MTTVLDAGDIDADSLPVGATVSAGSNRWLMLGVTIVHSTSAVGYGSMSYGGQSMTLLTEAEAADRDVVSQIWGLNEAGIVASSGTTFSSGGGTVSDIGSYWFSVEDAAQSITNVASSIVASATSGSLSLVRTANSLSFAVHSHDGVGVATIANPDNEIGSNVGGGRMQIGLEADTANTSDITWSHGTSRDHAIAAINIPEAGVADPEITGPATEQEGTAVTIAGTDLSGVTGISIQEVGGAHDTAQTIGTPTATTIGIADLTLGDTPTAGVPKNATPISTAVITEKSAGVTDYELEWADDGTATFAVDVSPETDFIAIQSMAAAADTTSASIYDSSVVTVEDDHQATVLATQTIDSTEVTLTLAADGIPEQSHNYASDWDVYLYSPSTGQKSLLTVSFTQTAAPTFDTAPDVTADDTGGILTCALDIAGDIYYAVVANDAGQPTDAAILAGTGFLAAGNDLNITEFSQLISGLDSDTAYDVWVLPQNLDTPPTIGTATKADFTTTGNSVPTGQPAITGTAQEDETLTASQGTLADPDGIDTIAYQWQRDSVDILGATSSTYTLVQADVGTVIRVGAVITDNLANVEDVIYSAATSTVLNVNDLPTGVPSITGTVTQGQTLTANQNTLADEDVISTIDWQWQRDQVNIGGATSSTYVLTQDDVGSLIRVGAVINDAEGTTESVIYSAETGAVANINDSPTGSVTIDNTTPSDGDLLTLDASSVADADGLGTFTYSWLRDDVPIGGETGTTYLVTSDDIGAVIKAQVDYTDTLTTAETVTSAGTTAVAGVAPSWEDDDITIYVAEGTNTINAAAALGSLNSYADGGTDAALITTNASTGVMTLASGVFTAASKDSYSYTTTASNAYGPDAVRTITLTVVALAAGRVLGIISPSIIGSSIIIR